MLPGKFGIVGISPPAEWGTLANALQQAWRQYIRSRHARKIRSRTQAHVARPSNTHSRRTARNLVVEPSGAKPKLPAQTHAHIHSHRKRNHSPTLFLPWLVARSRKASCCPSFAQGCVGVSFGDSGIIRDTIHGRAFSNAHTQHYLLGYYFTLKSDNSQRMLFLGAGDKSSKRVPWLEQHSKILQSFLFRQRNVDQSGTPIPWTWSYLSLSIQADLLASPNDTSGQCRNQSYPRLRSHFRWRGARNHIKSLTRLKYSSAPLRPHGTTVMEEFPPRWKINGLGLLNRSLKRRFAMGLCQNKWRPRRSRPNRQPLTLA